MSIKKSKMAAIAVNKSLLKEYMTNESSNSIDSTVYLNDGDEFQIQLFNPTQDVIGAEISINSDKLSGMIVLKPGERIWLERYLDTAKKFKFSTYEVDGNDSEVAEAIKNNGEVKVQFYKERKHSRDNGIHILNEPWNGYWKSDNYTTPDKNWDTITCGSSTCDTTLNSAFYCSSNLDSPVNASSKVCSYNKSLGDSYGSEQLSLCSCNTTIETGRINEGSYSSQKFTTVDNDFESWSFETVVIKILPASRKPYSSSDLQKVYCTECGRKLNPKYKFCPYCGAKVE